MSRKVRIHLLDVQNSNHFWWETRCRVHFLNNPEDREESERARFTPDLEKVTCQKCRQLGPRAPQGSP